jgi:UPF0716 protein FxsA
MFARLLLLFVTIPLIELMLLLLVGSRIGLWPTIAIAILTGILGASISRAQGLRAIARYQAALAEGRLPHEEVIEGLIIFVAGLLLLTPGFLTDTTGFLLLVPAVRQHAVKALSGYLAGRIKGTPSAAHQTKPPSDGVIEIEAEVIEERRAP